MAWSSPLFFTLWLVILLARAKGVTFSISSCEGLAKIPSPLEDNTHVVIEDDISCGSATIYISGPFAFLMTSNGATVTFENVRFVVKDEADFFMTLLSDDSEQSVTFISNVNHQSDGGGFKITAGSSATFGVPVAFQEYTVNPTRRGGAIFNEGFVTFEHSVKFDSNKVARKRSGGNALPMDRKMNSTALEVGCGGALYNGEMAVTSFKDRAVFSGNSAGLGSAGGAICNDGLVGFFGQSLFTGNMAEGTIDGDGGEGGAVYTGCDARTVFNKAAVFRSNRAGKSGGAMHTVGVTRMRNGGTFSRNRAAGGALYVGESGDAFFVGELEFTDNHALGKCHNVYDSSNALDVCPSVD